MSDDSEKWKINGGVYFGHQCHPPEDEDQPLAGAWSGKPDFHRYTGEGHLVTLGPSGVGKTRRLLVPNLYHLQDWSVLVVDPKGNLAVQTHLRRRENGHEIVTLDPFGVIASRYPALVEKYPDLKNRSINPIAALEPGTEEQPGDEFPDDAKKIGEALIKIEGKDPHWSQSAQALVAGLSMALRVVSNGEAPLADLRREISREPSDLAAALTARHREAARTCTSEARKGAGLTAIAAPRGISTRNNSVQETTETARWSA